MQSKTSHLIFFLLLLYPSSNYSEETIYLEHFMLEKYDHNITLSFDIHNNSDSPIFLILQGLADRIELVDHILVYDTTNNADTQDFVYLIENFPIIVNIPPHMNYRYNSDSYLYMHTININDIEIFKMLLFTLPFSAYFSDYENYISTLVSYGRKIELTYSIKNGNGNTLRPSQNIDTLVIPTEKLPFLTRPDAYTNASPLEQIRMLTGVAVTISVASGVKTVNAATTGSAGVVKTPAVVATKQNAPLIIVPPASPKGSLKVIDSSGNKIKLPSTKDPTAGTTPITSTPWVPPGGTVPTKGQAILDTVFGAIGDAGSFFENLGKLGAP